MKRELPSVRLLPIGMYAGAFVLAPMISVKFNFQAFNVGTQNIPSLLPLQTWLLAISIQALAWATIVFWAIPQFNNFASSGSNLKLSDWIRSVVATALLVTLLAAGSIVESKRGMPPPSIANISILHYFGPLGIALASSVICGLFLSYLQTIQSLSSNNNAVSKILSLADGLARVQQFFLAATVILALGVVGTSALRNAVEAGNHGTFPPEYVIFNGLTETLFLVTAYAHIRLQLFREAERLIEDALGAIPETLPDLVQRNKDQAALESMLGQNIASIFGIGGALPLFLPFVISIVAKLLDNGH